MHAVLAKVFKSDLYITLVNGFVESGSVYIKRIHLGKANVLNNVFLVFQEVLQRMFL